LTSTAFSCALSSLVLVPLEDKYSLNVYTFEAYRVYLSQAESISGRVNGRVLVPSRCYFEQSAARPLDGARISVKDNIDIAGHKTTLRNRAWEDLYPPKSKHADCVQTLVDAGAIIVGKAKLQAMVMREEPLECVEFTAPFNPRADGDQVPSGSSHGSAAGITSYDWLDYSLGSDSKCITLPICLLSSFDLLLDVAHTLQ
jgi:hypothetical protein